MQRKIEKDMYRVGTGDKFASRSIVLEPGLILPYTKTSLTRVLHSLLKEDLRPEIPFTVGLKRVLIHEEGGIIVSAQAEVGMVNY